MQKETSDCDTKRACGEWHLPVADLPTAVAVFDREMNYLAVSRRWIEAYGGQSPELAGGNFFVRHPETPPEWRRLHRELLAQGAPLSGENSWVKRDGARKWVKWVAQPWRNEAGAIAGIVVSAEDISLQKQAEAEREAARAAADRADRLLGEAVASIPQGFAIYDADDRLFLCNEHYRQCYESSRDLLVPGARFAEIVRGGAERGQYPQAQGRVEAWVEERLAIHRAADGRPFEQQLDDGRWLLVMEFRTPSGCIVGNRIDITERKQVEERLRQAATVIDCTQEGIVITDPDGVIEEVNPAFTHITEYPVEELKGQSMQMLQSGRHDRAFFRKMWDSLNTTGAWQGEIWNRRKGGEIYLEWLSISTLRDEAGRITNYVGITTDLSRMKHAQTELERLAHHDPLTRLPNRLLLHSRLEHALNHARRYGGRGAVFFIDLDHFKQVNDTLGHAAGDELLRRVTRRLEKRLRESDTLARLGGDEFVLVLEEIGEDSAATLVAEDIIEQLQQPFVLASGQVVRIGASIGIALFPGDADEAVELIALADRALYEAKRTGRGQYRLFAADAATPAELDSRPA